MEQAGTPVQTKLSKCRSGEGCSPEQYQHSFLGRVVSRLQVRLESMEVKIMTLSKVVRLLQDYTQKKDQQYEMNARSQPHTIHPSMSNETLQRQINNCQAHFQLIANQQQVQAGKVDQVMTHIAQLESGVSIREVEERMLEEVEIVRGKADRMEEAVLRQIRNNDFLGPATSIQRQEFDYAIEKMEYVKPRLCNCKHKQNTHKKEEDSYGLGTKKLSKSRQKQHQSSTRLAPHK